MQSDFETVNCLELVLKVSNRYQVSLCFPEDVKYPVSLLWHSGGSGQSENKCIRTGKTSFFLLHLSSLPDIFALKRNETHTLMYLKHMCDCVLNLLRETQIKVCPLIRSPLVIFIFTATDFLQCDNVCQVLNLLPGFFSVNNNGSVC